MKFINIHYQIRLVLYNASPIGAFERLILSVIHAEHPEATINDIREALEDLQRDNLANVETNPDGRWFAEFLPNHLAQFEQVLKYQQAIAECITSAPLVDGDSLKIHQKALTVQKENNVDYITALVAVSHQLQEPIL